MHVNTHVEFLKCWFCFWHFKSSKLQLWHFEDLIFWKLEIICFESLCWLINVWKFMFSFWSFNISTNILCCILLYSILFNYIKTYFCEALQTDLGGGPSKSLRLHPPPSNDQTQPMGIRPGPDEFIHLNSEFWNMKYEPWLWNSNVTLQGS